MTIVVADTSPICYLLQDAFGRLSRTHFRIDPASVRDALARDAGRKARRREIDP